MKRILSRIFLTSLIIFLFGCGNPESHPPVCKWEAISPAADSLTQKMEGMFHDNPIPDSISNALHLFKIASARTAGSEKLAMVRESYFKARIWELSGKRDSASREIAHASSIADSASAPYTWHRIQTLRRMLEPMTAERYQGILADYDWYSDVGDIPMTASSCVNIANALHKAAQDKKALEYLRKADSLNILAGLPNYVAKNRLNYTNVFANMQLTDSCRQVIDQLLEDPVVISDTSLYELVLRNAYLYTDDISFARRAFNLSSQRLNSTSLSLYAALLSLWYAEKENENPDSANHYADIAVRLMPDSARPGHLAKIWLAESKRQERLGNPDSALSTFRKSVELSNASQSKIDNADIIGTQGVWELAAMETDRAFQKKRHTMHLAILGMAIIILVTLFVIVLHLHRRKALQAEHEREIERMSVALEMEKNQRELLASTLAKQETARETDLLSQMVSELAGSGKIDETTRRTLDNAIAGIHERAADLRRIEEILHETSPQFVNEFTREYPGLSENQLKLATYIHIGLDNKEIANLLNVRPESVKQARWRLRSKMMLAKDDSLESILRSFGTTPP